MAEQTVREELAEALVTQGYARPQPAQAAPILKEWHTAVCWHQRGHQQDNTMLSNFRCPKTCEQARLALDRHRAEPEECCPLCDKPSPGGEVHQECADHEQFLADAAAEQERHDPVGREAV